MIVRSVLHGVYNVICRHVVRLARAEPEFCLELAQLVASIDLSLAILDTVYFNDLQYLLRLVDISALGHFLGIFGKRLGLWWQGRALCLTRERARRFLLVLDRR